MIPLTPNDLPVGQPLPWSLLDGQGNLLLGSGKVLADGRDVALVFRHGSVCRPDPLPVSLPADDAAPADAVPAHASGPLGLQVGTLLQIKAPDDGGRAAASRLIGFIDQGLFVSWPQFGGKDATFQAGEEVLLRGFTGRSIYSFHCTVTAVCRSPFRYLVLSVPTEVQQVPVRSSPRVQTRLAAQLMHQDGDTASPPRLAVLSDLSAGGALVQTAAPLPAPGTRLQLRFVLRTVGTDSEITVDAWARNPARDDGDAEFPAFGVAFDLLGEREAALLHCYIYEQLLAAARMPV
ncbi:flagellar brake protein [Cupriavidus cauae]|uniref:Flagellar brake protein n=1 Tax=Cupriavidus cauae TaxID=2608999 RepID=A0A5M8BAU9_9BURK|nr:MULTISPECIES: flagellar brake protein [Cupriavidus]KAA6131050.1 flagellar brake protein [Cupriavidus cauae]MCA7086127.1 flagellar brake protein [Cupriavidus sp. DB3]UZN50647.1 flagellar brake protein [Cupriavidus cauae]